MDRQHLTRALVRRNAYRGLFCRQLTQLPVAVLAHYSTVTIGQPPVSQPAHAAAAACQSCWCLARTGSEAKFSRALQYRR